MRDTNFISENNAKHMWHPMANAGEMRSNPPKVISRAEGVHITDIDGHRVIDGVGGLWNVNLGYSADSVKTGHHRPTGRSALLFDLSRHDQ